MSFSVSQELNKLNSHDLAATLAREDKDPDDYPPEKSIDHLPPLRAINPRRHFPRVAALS
jgi:hypothetical protein